MSKVILIGLVLFNLVLGAINYINYSKPGKVDVKSVEYYKFENELLRDELNRLENHVNRIKEIAGVKGEFSWKAKVLNPVNTRELLKYDK